MCELDYYDPDEASFVFKSDYEPGRWWRVLTPTGVVWCETSDESEARASMSLPGLAPVGSILQRQYVYQAKEWRTC